ncbi:phosphoenolpyruvate--protein phosphotransferase [Plantibacter sp. YIM 135249]|uniref:phosphoenolpyruvate--protein phosphotransferase n=1 Tax=Plantibacter sp. YIM 135249 TaxID=3423918 RepID=UPI003D356ABD
MSEPLPAPEHTPFTGDVEQEVARTLAALAETAAELQATGERAGGQAKDVLESQALMAEDPAIADGVRERITAGATGEYAVHEAFAEFQSMLTALGGYMAERATDLGDVSQRVIAKLRGVPVPGLPVSDTPFVLVARDLAPADTALLDLSKVLAVVTSGGGPTSHTAILARSKGIPALVGAEGVLALTDGTVVIVDAAAGTIDTEPTEAAITSARAAIAAREAEASAPVTPGHLADGTAVPLLANVGSADDAAAAIELGAEGVGLFRTEFLFLDAASAPTVESQEAQYRALFAAFTGKKVVVRVLDAGADKPLSFLTDEGEENPALGRRGLRALRAHEDILRDQLRALVEAAAGTGVELWVMAPMVADSEDGAYFTALARELGVQVAGVMVEVPSAALLAEQILDDADFISIGTNDLTQYTLAADRQLGTVAGYQDPWHPAVLRLVREAGRAGTATGKSVGVCGEAAADPLLAVVLVGLGVTSLSMSAAALADVRREIAGYTLPEAQELAGRVLTARTAADARAIAAEVVAARTAA